MASTPTCPTPPLSRSPPIWPRYTNDFMSCVGEDQECCGNKMRNKAEVLRYIDRSSHLTKKQQYAYTVNRPTRQYRVSTNEAFANTVAYIERKQCKENAAVRRFPAYYSDVPGKKLLYFDRKVPLINFRTTREYSTSPITVPLKLAE